jgi:hypothetical protein
MKHKIIILLAVLLTGGLSATPNRCCNGAGCATRSVKQAAVTPVRTLVMMIDDVELLPMHHYLNKF